MRAAVRAEESQILLRAVMADPLGQLGASLANLAAQLGRFGLDDFVLGRGADVTPEDYTFVYLPRAPAAVWGLGGFSAAILAVTLAAFLGVAWRLLSAHYQRVLHAPDDRPARGAMLLGAHYAGVAIEQSMLGATHACANPLTSRYGTAHGIAIGVMLPPVVRWNDEAVGDRYRDLHPDLPGFLEGLARIGALPASLRELGAAKADLPALAADAATQWTGTFNPRPFDQAAALALYERAY